jgi:F-box and WD-40 domain protein 1/11
MDFVDGTLSAVPRSFTVTRPSSPTLSHIIDTFSIISPSEVHDVSSSNDYSYPYAHPNFSLPTRLHPRTGGPALYASPVPGGNIINSTPFDRVASPNSLKSLIPRLWDALSLPGRHSLPRSPRFSPGGKGKERAVVTDIFFDHPVNFQDLPPLDGEEGELIDDEACFIDVRAVTGIGQSISCTFP